MSDRVCIRGCTQQDVHFSTCADYGLKEAYTRAIAAGVPNITYVPTCSGCAPRECRDGSMICDRCFGRMRGMLRDAPDLLGRLESLADPAKATPTDKAPSGASSSEPAAPVGADILDALATVRWVVAWWSGVDLAQYSNDGAVMVQLGDRLLTRHPMDEHGVRDAWSVQDAVDRFGIERRDRNAVEFVDEDADEVLTAAAVREWGDPVMPAVDVAARVGVTERTIRNWEKRELITRVATTRERQKRTAHFRLSEVLAVWEMKGAGADA